MAEQKQRKVFAVEKSMRSQEDGDDVSKNKQSMLTKAKSALDDTPFDLRQEITSLRAEMADIKEMLLHSAPNTASAPPEADIEEGMDRDLRIELVGMIRSISKAKSELAAIKHPGADDDRIAAASNELDAILLATENATNEILEATERVDKELTQIAALAHEDQDILLIADKIANEITSILEACSFQDITGQRITKVVTTMKFLEERILSMIDIWGFESLIDIPVVEATDNDGLNDEELLNGPQMENEGISQSDIDALFG